MTFAVANRKLLRQVEYMGKENRETERERVSLHAALICIFLESRLRLRLRLRPRLLAQLIINLLMLHILGFACLPGCLAGCAALVSHWLQSLSCTQLPWPYQQLFMLTAAGAAAAAVAAVESLPSSPFTSLRNLSKNHA